MATLLVVSNQLADDTRPEAVLPALGLLAHELHGAPADTNLVNVLVVEPRYADPVSLVHYKKVLVTKAAMDQLKEMFA